jgi:methionine-rich copper-binding protein CopC
MPVAPRSVAIRAIAVSVALVAFPGADRIASASLPAAVAPFHLRLEKSVPAQGAVLAAPPAVISLWFSLPPEMAVTTVKLADASGKAIAVSAPRRGNTAKDPVVVDITSPLAQGSYTVSWKTSSRDGHAIKGTIAFGVKAGAN